MASKSENKKVDQAESEAIAKGNGAEEMAGVDRPETNGRSEDVSVPEESTIEVAFRTYPEETYGHEELGISDEQVVEMYRNMLLQRRFEERSRQMYGRQKIAGFLHLYIGQEAVSTGSAHAIRIGEDVVITAYRDHGIGLALGMDPNVCMAELFGKIDGCSRGKGGSMHFFDKEKGMYGGHGIVGAHIPMSTGIAFANKYRGNDNVCLCFFGDGAINQGAFHEAANLASLYDLPLLLICENNQYGMGTHVERAAAEPDLYKQAVSYDMPGALVNGMDVFSVYKAITDHVELARENTPSLLEIRTYRYQGHSISDPAKYRTDDELEEKKSEDPIVRLKQYLLRNDLSSNEDLDAIDDDVKQVVLDAVEFADQSELPPLESIYEDIYTQEDYPFLA